MGSLWKKIELLLSEPCIAIGTCCRGDALHSKQETAGAMSMVLSLSQVRKASSEKRISSACFSEIIVCASVSRGNYINNSRSTKLTTVDAVFNVSSSHHSTAVDLRDSSM
jgi:hypothetical protein